MGHHHLKTVQKHLFRPLLSGWLILYRGGGWVGGSEAGWVGLSGFSPILGKMHIPPRGGWSGLLGGCGLLSLVDRQCCSWAKAHCDTWGCCFCGRICLCINKKIFTSVCKWSLS